MMRNLKIKPSWKKWLPYILLTVISIIFVFSRLYKLPETLWFFNDIGRDLSELYQWKSTGKPPLLGPQTSAIAYNQSAVYFYLLFPIYLLSGSSSYSTIFTALIFYLVFFWGGFYYLRKAKKLKWLWLVAIVLVTLQPQFIIQTRFVWNPTFVGLPLLLSFFAFHKLTKKFVLKDLLLFSALLSFAVSMNYSSASLAISFMILALIVFWKKLNFLKVWMVSFVSFLIWNAPTIFFEIRHDFFLTSLLFNGEHTKQYSLTLSGKLLDILNHAFVSTDWRLAALIVALSLVLAIRTYLFEEKHRDWIAQVSFLTIVNLAISLAIPISIQSHYVFPILILFFLLWIGLEKKSLIIMFILLSIVWVKPTLIKKYLTPTYRTVAEQEKCAQLICSQETSPIFISNQSGHHGYHNAMEWRYHFLENGCQVKLLDTQINEANLMAVVVDDSIYEHNKTAYNELTQFGPSRELKHYQCNENLEVVMLEKLSAQ